MARSAGIRRVVGTPIVVEGRHVGRHDHRVEQEETLPPDTESRLGQFTELMATAIANTESHARAERLAEEQAALRRVATLVAKGAPLAEVFAKVAEEVASMLGDVDCVLCSDEPRRDRERGRYSSASGSNRRRRGRREVGMRLVPTRSRSSRACSATGGRAGSAITPSLREAIAEPRR